MKIKVIKSFMTASVFLLSFSALAQEQQVQIEVKPEPSPSNAQSAAPPAPAPELSTYERKNRECPCLYSARHVLAGHAFLPAIEQPAAFADSRASLGLGVGQGSYGVISNGTNTTVNLVSFAPSLNLQIAITPRLAIFGGFTSGITTGLNSESALVYGGSVRYAWNFGGLFELFRDDDTVLSVALQINKPHTLAASPLESSVQAEQAVLTGVDPELATTTIATEYRPSLRLAHGFNSSLGVQLSLGADVRSTTTNGSSTDGTLFTAALGLSSDFNPWISVPVGLTLTVSRNQIISRSESNSDLASIGLWETFTHRHNIGAELGWYRRSGLDSAIGTLLARLYFN